VQPAIPTTIATAAAAFTTLAHFINVPFGLLIRDVLITDATPVSKFRRIRRGQLHQICIGNATPNTVLVFEPRQWLRGGRCVFVQQSLSAFAAGIFPCCDAFRSAQGNRTACCFSGGLFR
jgi:hypothetical protein